MNLINKDKAEKIVSNTTVVRGDHFQFGKNPSVNFELVKTLIDVATIELGNGNDAAINKVRENLNELSSSVKAIGLLTDKNFAHDIVDNKKVVFKNAAEEHEFDISSLDTDTIKGICSELKLRSLTTRINGTSRERIALAATAFEQLIQTEKKISI